MHARNVRTFKLLYKIVYFCMRDLSNTGGGIHRIFEHFSIHKLNVIELMKKKYFLPTLHEMVWMDFTKKNYLKNHANFVPLAKRGKFQCNT